MVHDAVVAIKPIKDDMRNKERLTCVTLLDIYLPSHMVA